MVGNDIRKVIWIKIYTSEQIIRNGFEIEPSMTREQYFALKWIKIDDLIKELKEDVKNYKHGVTENEHVKDMVEWILLLKKTGDMNGNHS